MYFTLLFVRQKLSNNYAELTPTSGMLPSSAQICDPFWMLRFIWKWDKGIEINPGGKTVYTT